MIVWIIVGILVVALFLMNGREGFQQPIRARYIKLTSNTYIQMSQLKVISLGVNVAYQKPVTASSEIVPGMAKKAVDGNSAPRSFPDIYQSAKESAWWQVDLGKDHVINEIVFYNRSDGCT